MSRVSCHVSRVNSHVTSEGSRGTSLYVSAAEINAARSCNNQPDDSAEPEQRGRVDRWPHPFHHWKRPRKVARPDDKITTGQNGRAIARHHRDDSGSYRDCK